MEEGGASPKVQEEHLRMLVALVRAYQDGFRPNVQSTGLDERDVAYEAGMLTPKEVELTVYATQKRGRVLRLLREMESWGWVGLQVAPPQGAYSVFLYTEGLEVAREHLRPWWSRVVRRFRSQG